MFGKLINITFVEKTPLIFYWTFSFKFYLIGLLIEAHLLSASNHGNNIVGLFDVLPNFPCTARETKRDYL